MTRFAPYFAIVCDNRDPQRIGRVEVQLPWLDGDVAEARWAQLAAPFAGDRCGWRAVPEVGDTVVVMFVAGDPSRPVVVGGVWSTAAPPPEPDRDGKNQFRGYCSRAGHRLVLDDSPSGKLVIADRGGAMVAIGAFAAAGEGPNALAAPRPASAGDGGVAIASPHGTLAVVAGGTVAIAAGRDVAVAVAADVDVAAGGDVAIDGAAVALTAGAAASIDAPMVELG